MKRKLSVQQQNDITETYVRDLAKYWREHLPPEALQLAAKEKNVALSESIILELDFGNPEMPILFGILLTHDERFIRFMIDSDQEPAHCMPIKIEQWEDITGKQNVNSHNRGFGLGYGAIALRTLHEFNGK